MKYIPGIISDEHVIVAERTMSPRTFFYIVMSRLMSRQSLSVVRMGDGEQLFLQNYHRYDPEQPMTNTFYGLHSTEEKYHIDWLKRMGMYGVTPRLVKERLELAVFETEYFAPNLIGMRQKPYNLYKWFNHPKLVDNYFVNDWESHVSKVLYKVAKDVLLIHSSPRLIESVQREMPDVNFSHILLNNANQTEEVIEKAASSSSHLVLFSAGLAGKYIGPRISKSNKVVLDIGNAAIRWFR